MSAVRAELTISAERIAAETVFVLEEDGQVVGFYSLKPQPTFGEVDLMDLFVEPHAIGQGYGKRLWQHAVETARQAQFYAVLP